MTTYSELLEGLPHRFIAGDPHAEVTSVVFDSRKVKPGSLFVCVKGFVTDGHDYLSSAIERGAVAILIDENQTKIPEPDLASLCLRSGVSVASSPSGRRALAHVSARFFGMPSEKLPLYGVTGTKGKTTTTYMIRDILLAQGLHSGLIGTVSNIVGGHAKNAERTTPESYDVQEMLDGMVKAKDDACVMEVSSQGLMLHRVYGCKFRVGAFTNLYHDHIGEHEHANMREYLDAKLLLFDSSDIGIVNLDCSVSDQVLAYAKSRCTVYTYSLEGEADVTASDLCLTTKDGRVGTEFYLRSPWFEGKLFVAMPGRFNVYNALCAAAVSGAAGIPFEAIRKGLSSVFVPGRLQSVPNTGSFHVLVDYAHNAASLESLLTTLREYCEGRLITLFGCGGDRARSRRFEMGEVSGKMSDLTVITSDNPRSEDPTAIIDDILVGFRKTSGKYLLEPDRRKAIALALSEAVPGDFVIIAGKGHENYQIFKDRTIHFDDAEEAEAILRAMQLFPEK